MASNESVEATIPNFNHVIEQDEDGWYVASVPSLPGCYTQARSLDELAVRVREAIEVCLEEDPSAVTQERTFFAIQQIAL